jgi:hypothetical protein
MRERLPIILITALVLTTSAAQPADESDFRFTGDTSDRTAVFETSGPWLLDWSIRKKSGLPTNFEMRLFAADTGEFIGTIAQLEGVGRGLKLFEDAGSFQIQVVAQNLIWDLHIEVVDPETAADTKRLAEVGLSLEDKSKKLARRIPEGSFRSWRPVDDETLLLFAEDGYSGFRVTFEPPCPGLAEATALSFVTALNNGMDDFNSVLLDDGTRCFFKRVFPTVFE